MRRGLLALVAWVLLSHPAAALEPASAQFSFPDTFATLRVVVDAPQEGDNATRLRTAMDADADGRVTEDEAARFAVANREAVAGAIAPTFADGNVSADGNPPTGLRLVSLQALGAAGPVGPATLRIHFVLELDYPVMRGSDHHVVVRGDGRTPVQYAVEAPAGYVVATSSLPHTSAGAAGLTAGDVVVEFMPAPRAAPSSLLAALGGLAVAVVRSRRPRQ